MGQSRQYLFLPNKIKIVDKKKMIPSSTEEIKKRE